MADGDSGAAGEAAAAVADARFIRMTLRNLTFAPSTLMLPSVFASSSHALPLTISFISAGAMWTSGSSFALTARIESDGSHSSVCFKPRPETERVIDMANCESEAWRRGGGGGSGDGAVWSAAAVVGGGDLVNVSASSHGP